MPIRAGSRLGPYELLAPIGAGGMGEVWRGKDTRLDRSVAVKILPAAFAEDEERRQRFEREAKAISSLNHPHICTLFDVGHEGDLHFLVMELLEGEVLADRLQKGPLPLDQVVKLGAQVAEALSAAHKQGIVHRDLKPGNVVLTKTGAKLLDFGLARTGAGLGGPSGSTELPTEMKPLTTAGTVLGTFQYMAPEQLEGAEADARTDIFALGALLYEMATARRAFEGKSKTSLIAAILASQPPPISQVVPVMPPALDHVVTKCLEKDPDDRWQSAHDVASELRWIGEAGSQAGVPTTLALRRRSRERLAWLLAGGLGLLLALALVPATRHWRERPPESTPVRFTIAPPDKTAFAPWDLPAVSPDGKRIVFVAAPAGGGRHQLWMRSLDSLAAQPLPGTEGGYLPFWSPDARAIGFFDGMALKRVDVAGGAAQTQGVGGGTWNQHGEILFAGAIFVASIDGPEVQQLVTADSAAVYAPPGHLLYVRGGTLMAQPFDDEPVLETEHPENADDWSPDGRLVVYDTGLAAATAAGADLWVAPREGDRKPIPFLVRPFVDTSAQISRDGRFIAYMSNESGRPEVYVMDFPKPTAKWKVSTAGGSEPRWRSDGRELFYLAGRKLMAVDVRAAGATLEAGVPRALFEADLSPVAGRHRYVVSPDGQRFLIIAPAEQAGPTPLTVVLNWR